jgi:arylsulfatase A
MKYFALILLFLQYLPCSSRAVENPNIILIYVDDMGYGDASILNPKSRFKTPNIDRLAREGITLTDGHSSDTVCTPSRYGLLTGRYSWRTNLKRGVMGAEGACLIKDKRMTLASLLRDNGYATAMVGKWHLGMDFPGTKGNRDWKQPVKDMPLDKGFDYYWGIPASMNYGVLAWFEGRHAKVPPLLFTSKKPSRIAIADYRIMPPYQKSAGEAPDPRESGGRKGNPKGKGLEVAPDFIDRECLTRFTDKSIAWIRGKADNARKDKPFFLYLPFTSPHKPVIPLPEFRGQGTAGAYGEFMIETDHHVGRILKLLDQEKLAENTLVIFTSDNGPETTWKKRAEKFSHRSNGIYREGKRSIYEGGHRVPFIMRWPAKVKPGSKLNAPVCQTDLLATLAQMLGKNLPNTAGEDSNSFYAEMISPGTLKERPPIIHHSSQGRFAIREGKWKLIMRGAKQAMKSQLYDLEGDPREATNLAARHPEIVTSLTAKITAIINNGRSSPGTPVKNDTPGWNDLHWMK